MKKLILYFLSIILPVILILTLKNEGIFNDVTFIFVCFVYLILYRPIVDYFRLVDKGLISKNQFLSLFNPGTTFKYFKDLFTP